MELTKEDREAIYDAAFEMGIAMGSASLAKCRLEMLSDLGSKLIGVGLNQQDISALCDFYDLKASSAMARLVAALGVTRPNDIHDFIQAAAKRINEKINKKVEGQMAKSGSQA